MSCFFKRVFVDVNKFTKNQKDDHKMRKKSYSKAIDATKTLFWEEKIKI